MDVDAVEVSRTRDRSAAEALGKRIEEQKMKLRRIALAESAAEETVFGGGGPTAAGNVPFAVAHWSKYARN